MTEGQFIKAVNDQRAATRGAWYQVSGTVHGNRFEIKAYRTWLQICRVYNPVTGQPINFSGQMDSFKLANCPCGVISLSVSNDLPARYA